MKEDDFKLKADVSLQNNSINEYYDEMSNDLIVNIFNIKERSLALSAIRSKWLMYLFKEKENLKRLKTAKTNNMKKLLEQANNDLTRKSIVNRKLEDEINAENTNMLKLNSTIEITSEVVQFLEISTNIFNDFGFTIKNALECFKLEQM